MSKLFTVVALILAVSPGVAAADDMADVNHMIMDAASPADKAFMQSMQKMMRDMNATGRQDSVAASR